MKRMIFLHVRIVLLTVYVACVCVRGKSCTLIIRLKCKKSCALNSSMLIPRNLKFAVLTSFRCLRTITWVKSVRPWGVLPSLVCRIGAPNASDDV
jgi:hypothetical protein